MDFPVLNGLWGHELKYHDPGIPQDCANYHHDRNRNPQCVKFGEKVVREAVSRERVSGVIFPVFKKKQGLFNKIGCFRAIWHANTPKFLRDTAPNSLLANREVKMAEQRLGLTEQAILLLERAITAKYVSDPGFSIHLQMFSLDLQG